MDQSFLKTIEEYANFFRLLIFEEYQLNCNDRETEFWIISG